MTSEADKRSPLTKNHEGDIPSPEWIVFGDQRLRRVLFLLHHQDDTLTDRFYPMQKKMTVFGFGRQGIDKLIDTVPQQFSIGIMETTNYREIADRMKAIMDQQIGGLDSLQRPSTVRHHAERR